MGTETWVAGAIVLGLMAGPSMAEENAHHYQGVPKTGVPHLTGYPGGDQPAGQTKRPANRMRFATKVVQTRLHCTARNNSRQSVINEGAANPKECVAAPTLQEARLEEAAT